MNKVPQPDTVATMESSESCHVDKTRSECENSDLRAHMSSYCVCHIQSLSPHTSPFSTCIAITVTLLSFLPSPLLLFVFLRSDSFLDHRYQPSALSFFFFK